MAPTPCLLREYSLDSSLRSTLRRKLSLNCVGTSVLMGRLYVVATPIGNLEDMSLRALRALGDVGLIVAEDTRTAHVLLRRHHLKNRLLSYNEHNKARRIPEILARLVETDAALVSDAGTPAISDPGVELVAAARAAGHEGVAGPGASAAAGGHRGRAAGEAPRRLSRVDEAARGGLRRHGGAGAGALHGAARRGRPRHRGGRGGTGRGRPGRRPGPAGG